MRVENKQEELLQLIDQYYEELQPEVDKDLIAEVARAFIVDSKKSAALSVLIQSAEGSKEQ